MLMETFVRRNYLKRNLVTARGYLSKREDLYWKRYELYSGHYRPDDDTCFPPIIGSYFYFDTANEARDFILNILVGYEVEPPFKKWFY